MTELNKAELKGICTECGLSNDVHKDECYTGKIVDLLFERGNLIPSYNNRRQSIIDHAILCLAHGEVEQAKRYLEALK